MRNAHCFFIFCPFLKNIWFSQQHKKKAKYAIFIISRPPTHSPRAALAFLAFGFFYLFVFHITETTPPEFCGGCLSGTERDRG